MVQDGRNGRTVDGPLSLVSLEAFQGGGVKEFGCAVLGRRDEEAAVLGQLHVVDGFGVFRHQVDLFARPGKEFGEMRI